MIGSLLLGGLAMMALGFAHEVAVIAPGCFLVAILNEAYRPAMQAAVADLVPANDRVRAFGILYWVINLGFSFGLTVAGLLATRSFLLLFLGDGFTSILFAFLVWRYVPETRPVHAEHEHGPRPGLVHGFLAPYRDAPFAGFIALSLLVLLLFMQHVAALPIGMSETISSKALLGFLLALNGIVIVLLQPILAPIITRWNRSRTLALGAALVGLGFGVNAFAHDAWQLAFGIVVWTVGEIFVLPIGNAVVADVAPAHLRGRYQGAYGICFGLAGFGAPLLGTAVLQRFGSTALWSGCFAVGLAAALGHLTLEPALSRLRAQRLATRNAT
jgi:MFS family permease